MNSNNNELPFLVNSDELFKEIAKRKDHPELSITLINVLPKYYFDDCRIKDSINIEEAMIADVVDDWDRTRAIIIYGASDDLTISKIAFQRLTEMGFDNVRILIGGMQEWLDDEYPVDGACKMDYLQ